VRTRYVPPVQNNTGGTATGTTPEPTPFPVEVTSPSPDANTQIVVEPDKLGSDQTSNLNAENSASASSWIFGFIVGLIIGGLIGRASWGIRRRRRQQIFG
jgi:hypothetical protein